MVSRERALARTGHANEYNEESFGMVSFIEGLG
jgi:hypothetical protein